MNVHGYLFPTALHPNIPHKRFTGNLDRGLNLNNVY